MLPEHVLQHLRSHIQSCCAPSDTIRHFQILWNSSSFPFFRLDSFFTKEKKTEKVRNERKMGNSWSFSLFPGSSSPPSRLGVKVYLILIKYTCSSSSAGIKGAPHCRVLCGCTETSCHSTKLAESCFKLEHLRVTELFDCLQSWWVSYKPTNGLFMLIERLGIKADKTQ